MTVSTREETTLSLAVAEEIRVLLARRMMRQSELAKALGVDDMWVSRKLRGSQKITLDDLALFATGLGVSVIDLIPASARGAAVEPTHQ
jgi:transcriptional regulator with XRE-family HTH domain